MTTLARHRRRFQSASALLILVALTGCHDDAPPIGQVTGTVTHQGKLVPNLTISFMPTNGRPSWGMTDSDGRYTLHWDEDHDGAEVGKHMVSVAFVPGSQSNEGGRAKTAPATPQEQKSIINKYGIDKSSLTMEVKSGRQTIDLKLD